MYHILLYMHVTKYCKALKKKLYHDSYGFVYLLKKYQHHVHYPLNLLERIFREFYEFLELEQLFEILHETLKNSY
jgi:hypothetical protein